MDSSDWLLQYDDQKAIKSDSYERFINELWCLDSCRADEYKHIYQAWLKRISPASTDEQLLYIEIAELLKVLKDSSVQLNDGSSIDLDRFKLELKVKKVDIFLFDTVLKN